MRMIPARNTPPGAQSLGEIGDYTPGTGELIREESPEISTRVGTLSTNLPSYGAGMSPLSSAGQAFDWANEQISGIKTDINTDVERAIGFGDQALETILGLGNDALFNPDGRFAQDMRANIRNLSSEYLDKAQSEAAAAAGARGLRGTSAAALQQNAVADALRERGAMETNLSDQLTRMDTAFRTALAGVIPQISNMQSQLLATKDRPFMDPLPYLQNEQDFNQWQEAFNIWQQEFEDSGKNFIDWFQEGDLYEALLGPSGIIQSLLLPLTGTGSAEGFRNLPFIGG